MEEHGVKPVAVIVPAYNEEQRILRVLRAVAEARLVTEVIVVSDGSRDRTAEVARKLPGVRVVELPFNVGKGGAMAAGVASTEAEVLAFVDADLSGLTGAHIDRIIRPVLEGNCDMCVGIFRGGKVWSDVGHRISPFLSGQRALRRDLFEAVPYMAELRMGVEIALTKAAKRRHARVRRVVLPGVSNYHKEQKLGLVKGTAARMKMYTEIAEATFKTRRKPPRSPRRPWL
jgi:glycosyltransferase involved in cell wall biosynthesis